MKIEVKVNTDELRGERTRQKKSVQYMANLIGKHYSSYSKKENGEVKFDVDEIVIIALDLNLSPEMIDLIFFDSRLLFGNSRMVLLSHQ